MQAYDKGDTALLTGTFRNAAGALTDPATVRFRFVDPADVATTWTYGVAAQVTRSSIGVYVAPLPLPTVGLWSYHWTTEAGAVEDSVIQVRVLSTDRSQAQQLARNQLSRMTAADEEPTLDDAALDDLLYSAQLEDGDGIAPSEDDWTPTYDLNAAAAEGWRWKAARAASSYAFTMDGDFAERSILHLRCKEMAEMYRRRIVSSVPIVTDLS
jgi:hypothetical protein